MSRTQLIPQETADSLFEQALSIGACAEDLFAEFENLNPEVTWSQVQRWRRDWEGRTGKKLNLTAPASVAEGDVQGELSALSASPAPETAEEPIATPRAGKRPRKARASKPRRKEAQVESAVPKGWEAKTFVSEDGAVCNFLVPSAWLQSVRDILVDALGAI